MPNDKGEIRFRSLSAATYRFEVRLPAFGWYLKTLALPKPDANIARNGITLKQGEKISGVAIVVVGISGLLFFTRAESTALDRL